MDTESKISFEKDPAKKMQMIRYSVAAAAFGAYPNEGQQACVDALLAELGVTAAEPDRAEKYGKVVSRCEPYEYNYTVLVSDRLGDDTSLIIGCMNPGASGLFQVVALTDPLEGRGDVERAVLRGLVDRLNQNYAGHGKQGNGSPENRFALKRGLRYEHPLDALALDSPQRVAAAVLKVSPAYEQFRRYQQKNDYVISSIVTDIIDGMG